MKFSYIFTLGLAMSLTMSIQTYENNRNIWAWDYVNDGTDNWYIVSDGNGWYRLICKRSGKAMSVTSDRNVVQRDSDSGTDQKWRLRSKDE